MSYIVGNGKCSRILYFSPRHTANFGNWPIHIISSVAQPQRIRDTQGYVSIKPYCVPEGHSDHTTQPHHISGVEERNSLGPRLGSFLQ